LSNIERQAIIQRIILLLLLKIVADAGVAIGSAVKYIVSVRDREGSMLACAHASTVYKV